MGWVCGGGGVGVGRVGVVVGRQGSSVAGDAGSGVERPRGGGW